MTDEDLYIVAVTAIIEKEGKYLITKRPDTKARWPGKWTVPGGRLEPSDYRNFPKDTEREWYNILERVVRREVREEAGLDIKDVDYLASIVAEHDEASPHALIISLSAKYAGGVLKPDPDEVVEALWVTLEEAKEYDLIGGIYGELVMAEERRVGVRREWQSSS